MTPTRSCSALLIVFPLVGLSRDYFRIAKPAFTMHKFGFCLGAVLEGCAQ
jgi:hypothetical protein